MTVVIDTHLLTAPRLSVWKQYDKQRIARRFVMPVWSYSELLACRVSCFADSVTEEEVRDAFRCWYVYLYRALLLTEPKGRYLSVCVGEAEARARLGEGDCCRQY